MKSFLFIILLAGCGDHSDINVVNPDISIDKIPAGTIIRSCYCSNYSRDYVGKSDVNIHCASGYSLIQICEECCEYWNYECVKSMFKEYCL